MTLHRLQSVKVVFAVHSTLHHDMFKDIKAPRPSSRPSQIRPLPEELRLVHPTLCLRQWPACRQPGATLAPFPAIEEENVIT